MKRQIKGRPSAHTQRERERRRPSDINLVHTSSYNKPNRPRPLSCRKSNVCRERREKKKREAKVDDGGGRRVCAGFVAWVFFFSLLVRVVRVHHCHHHHHHCQHHHYHYDPHVSHGALAAHIFICLFRRPLRVPGRFHGGEKKKMKWGNDETRQQKSMRSIEWIKWETRGVGYDFKHSVLVGLRACAHRREWRRRRAGAMALRSIRGHSER